MKHAHHGFDVDQPGKDSYVHRQAGATEVLVASEKRWALMHELRETPEPTAAELAKHMTPGRPAAGRRLQARAARQAGNLPRGQRQAAALHRRSDLCRDPHRRAGQRHQAAGDRPQRRAGHRRLHREALQPEDRAVSEHPLAAIPSPEPGEVRVGARRFELGAVARRTRTTPTPPSPSFGGGGCASSRASCSLMRQSNNPAPEPASPCAAVPAPRGRSASTTSAAAANERSTRLAT